MGKKTMKDKLLIIFYCVVLGTLYFGLSGIGVADEEESFTELKNIFAATDKYDIAVTEWTLYTRDYLSHLEDQNEFEKEFREIREKTKEFNWDSNLTMQDNGQMRAVGKLEHPEKQVTEALTYIVFPHNEKHHSYLIYEVIGSERNTDDHLQTLLPLINSRLEDLFKHNSKIFTCVTGNGSDKLNFGLYEKAEMLVNEFSAEKIEQLKEETFISISAYNNTWNNAIQTSNDQKMNLQVAIRINERLGGKTTVTIGTPIITTEY